MGGQFHDIAAGTATPRAYEFSWNDDVLAMNQFTDVLTNAVDTVSSALDTQTKGTPIVVYNPLNIAREDVVEVPSDKPVRVFGPDGNEVPSQLSNGKAIFLARVPSVGFAVYDMREGARASRPQSTSVSLVDQASGRDARTLRPGRPLSIQNARYRIRIDANGDVSSIF